MGERFRRAVVAGGDARDVALFGLMYRFGLRATETTYLLREDVDLVRGRIQIRRAKHGDTKEYPLPRDLVPALRRYLRRRSERACSAADGPLHSSLHPAFRKLSVRHRLTLGRRGGGGRASVAGSRGWWYLEKVSPAMIEPTSKPERLVGRDVLNPRPV